MVLCQSTLNPRCTSIARTLIALLRMPTDSPFRKYRTGTALMAITPDSANRDGRSRGMFYLVVALISLVIALVIALVVLSAITATGAVIRRHRQ